MNELAIVVILVLFTWCIGLNAWFVRVVRRYTRSPPALYSKLPALAKAGAKGPLFE